MNSFSDSEVVLFIERGYRPTAIIGQPGFFLLCSRKAELFEEPTDFLYNQFVTAGVSPSAHSWNKAAYCLKTWFQYCQARGKDWRAVTSIDRTDFRDDFSDAISPHTGETYGPKGIRDTMAVVKKFYRYAARKGWYFGDLGEYWNTHEEDATSRPSKIDALFHTRAGNIRKRDTELPKVGRSQKIRALRLDDLRTLFNYAGPQATLRRGDMRNCRDRLICDIGFFVGLRVEEIAKLTTLQFLNLTPDENAPYISQVLTINGKGNVTRQVEIPNWLVLDACEYINTERAAALARCKNPPRVKSTRLLLGHLHSNNGEGRPITRGAIQKMVERACLASGLTDTDEKTDPETGQVYFQKVARYSVHDLRHSYAVYTYHDQVKKGIVEPWKKIQAQLGHARLQTTIDTYLAHVSIFSHQPALFNIRRTLGLA